MRKCLVSNTQALFMQPKFKILALRTSDIALHRRLRDFHSGARAAPGRTGARTVTAPRPAPEGFNGGNDRWNSGGVYTMLCFGKWDLCVKQW